MTQPTGHLTRRSLLTGAAALPLFSILTHRADAAEFELKYATGQDPTHPVNVRAKEALDRIREATSGRVNIKLFPANQLGSDTDLLAQVRNGSVEFFNLSSLILATFVPVSGITSVGFAFKNYDDVWKAMDGDLGNHIRAEIAETIPLGRLGRAADIAGACVFLASDLSLYCTGITLDVNGGMLIH